MTKSVARLIVESLEAHEVDQVYCVPGESYIGLTSTMVERNSIRVIVCRHEGGAGFMAAADGRLRNRAGRVHGQPRARPFQRAGGATLRLS